MKIKTFHAAFVIFLFIFSILFAACSQKRTVDVINYGPAILLPKGVNNADPEAAVPQGSGVIVSIPATGQFYVGSETYPIDQLGEIVSRRLAAQTDGNKVLYFAGSYHLDYGDVVQVLDTLRKEGISTIGLLAEHSSAIPRASLRVQIPPEPKDTDVPSDKPNPLTLVVEIKKDLKLTLNNDPIGDANDPSKLTAMLTKTFQQRKELHVYKAQAANDNNATEDERIEKTVTIKAVRSARYADVMHLIDAVKGAGANPIVLQVDDLSD